MNGSVLPPRGPVVTLGVETSPKPFHSLFQLGFPGGYCSSSSWPLASERQFAKMNVVARCGLERATASLVEVVIVNVVIMRDSVVKAGVAAGFVHGVWR
jgi:hypothetical protein